MSITCPRCGRVHETGAGLAIHWGMTHDGPLPDDIDTSLSDEHKENIRLKQSESEWVNWKLRNELE